MDPELLVTSRIDSGERLVREFDRAFPVSAAFWLKQDEEEPWYLHVASDRIDENSLDQGYDEINRLVDALGDPGFDPFQVKLIPSANPLAQAVIEANRKYPANIVARAGGRYLGGRTFEGTYIYPIPRQAVAG